MHDVSGAPGKRLGLSTHVMWQTISLRPYVREALQASDDRRRIAAYVRAVRKTAGDVV